jgi:hypothetical protein
MPRVNTLLDQDKPGVSLPGSVTPGGGSVNTPLTAANKLNLYPGSTEGLTPHKGHFHTATGQKTLGGGFTTDTPGERLFKHKDHFHTEQTDDQGTIKVGGPGTINEETGALEYGHKDHAHGVDGEKIPGSTNPDIERQVAEGVPTDEDVMRASLAAQRKALRKGQLRGRLSTIMHSKFNKTDQLG